MFDDFSRHRIEEHYTKSHPKQWALYQRAVSQRGRSSRTNNSFFQAERITGHFARRDPSGESKVVSKAVGDIAARLFSKEEDPAARTATGLVLQKMSAADDSSDDEDDDESSVEQYVVALPSRATFLRVIDLVSLGLSFVQVAETISQERELFSGGRSMLTNVTRRDVTVYTRLVAVLGLEALSSVMQQSWAYALAADSSAHIGGTSYFCVRVRIPPLSMHDDICNLHLVAPPMCGSHTGEYMFNVTSEVLGALDPDWRTKLIGATSDGAANMVGSVSGWQTRLCNAAADSESFYLMHCGTHQLNLINGKAIAAIGHEGSNWLEKLHAIVKWLRKQANFIESLGSQSPYYIEVRWTSLEAVLAWWRRNQDEVIAHCLGKDKEIADDVEWWLVLIIVHEHFKAIGGAMRALQGKALLVEGQLEKLEQLRGQIAEMHCITRRSGHTDSRASSKCDELPLSDDLNGEKITYQGSGLATVVACGPWQARLQDIWNGVSKHGLDAWDLHETIVDTEDEESSWKAAAAAVTKDVAVLGLTTVQGLSRVLKQERSKDRPIPLPCRPLPLTDLTSEEFLSRILKLRARLTRNRSAEFVRAACEEHQALKRELLRSPDAKAELKHAAAAPTASFQSCWRPLLPRYPNLREVAAGLATIFPGSSSVESDFSILKLDKSPQRSNLADLTIEGQFYARQWRELERLEAMCKERQQPI
jgi:hypothetical protein